MQHCVFLHVLHALLVLLQTLIIHASPAAIGVQPPLPALNESTSNLNLLAMLKGQPSLSNSNGGPNDVHLHCFTPVAHPDRGPTNVNDCKSVLEMIVSLPDSLTPYRFSKNKRRLDVIPLPKGWRTRDCIIFVSCENDRDMDVFRLADAARQARNIIQNCVEGETTPYGGIDGVGSVGSFYVSVGRPVGPRGFVNL
ncbi:hypothetical protein N7G274_005641 [Stereocaulon virgatum]|uniref:Uncharacterized protein n=1 Tax=Stereocaulon virgatum TaxID=373712 RepID=A0ABR4AAE0_9LECA